MIIFVIFFAFFIFIIFIGIQQAKKTRVAWAEAARELGLHYPETASKWRRGSISGTLDGIEVYVDTYTVSSGKNSTTYTRFRAGYPKSLGLGLKLTREGFFAGVTKFFGAQDIQVGDAAFDDGVVVKGTDPTRLKAFLTPARRLRILRVINAYRGVEISDNEVLWRRVGVVRDIPTLVNTVRVLVKFAACMGDEREEDKALGRAMEAQQHGRIEEALSELKSRPTPTVSARASAAEASVAPGVLDVSVEEKVLEGELLYLAGKKDEARDAFKVAQEQAPDDPDIQGWIETTDAAAAPADAGADRPLDVETVCQTLFDPKKPSYEASREFETHYQGKTVEWRGKLRSAKGYTYDFVFGSDGGTKATLEVFEVPEVMFGEKTVLALVQLPKDQEADLDAKTGQELTVRGRLLKVDAFMRNVFIADAEII